MVSLNPINTRRNALRKLEGGLGGTQGMEGQGSGSGYFDRSFAGTRQEPKETGTREEGVQGKDGNGGSTVPEAEGHQEVT